jgi:hypothetical protein
VTGFSLWARLALLAALLTVFAAGVWKIRTWGYNASETKWLAKAAQDDLNAKKDTLRALEAGKINLEQSLNILQEKTNELDKIKAGNAGLQLGLKRVLDAAQQCGDQAVPAGQTTSGYDASNPQWYLERGGGKPN